MTVRKETDHFHSQREWVTAEKKEQEVWPSCKAANFSPGVTLPAARLHHVKVILPNNWRPCI